MISSHDTSKRRIVPRWRPLLMSVVSQELAMPRPLSLGAALPLDLVDKLERWRVDSSVVTASELVEAANVYGLEPEALRAAQFLVWPETKATSSVRKHAAELLTRVGFEVDVPKELRESAVKDAHEWRSRTRTNPRDAFAWLELARLQAARGHDDHAERSLLTALQIAPHDRHTLRSASRFFLHRHDPERAHHLIARNDATPHDPWLLAAEIALASVAKRNPRFFKVGQQTLDAANAPKRQITELAGALGTQALLDGNRKKGKQLFRTSLDDPTGNSLAQAEWAASELGDLMVDTKRLVEGNDSTEALSRRLYKLGRFEASFDIAKAWIEEEPFSGAAYQQAMHCAALLERYDEGERLAKQALAHSPRSKEHRFSLVFALACQNKLDDAERELRSIAVEKDGERGVAEADWGLIEMRRGNLLKGAERYRNAISTFRRAGLRDSETVALAYFAREAAFARHDIAPLLLQSLKAENSKWTRPHISFLMATVEKALASPAAQEQRS